MNWSDIASGVSILLTVAGYVPYIRAIRANHVKPHFFSWLIWSLTTAIVFFAQLAASGGAGAWPTGVSAVITIYVAWLALVLRSDFTNTRSDWMFLIVALLSLPLWYATDDPLWSVVILTSVDALGFAPTLRKTWARPHEESLQFYALFAVRSALSIFALASLSWTTVLFPVVMIVACILVCLMLLWRRRALSSR
ncbi:MAG TPA: hypothetical protein VMH83_05610 [Candidatus Acidoferrum sp.]|nr:hypothetical protein [Candidatus Acidoferrum sp.]